MRAPLFFAGLVLTGMSASFGDAHTPADVRKSIARALPFIETEGVAWMKERKCMSCHVVPFMVWSFNEAHAHGVKVDEKKLAEWTVWSVNDSNKHRTWFKLPEPNAKKKIDPYPEAIRTKIEPLLSKGFDSEVDFLMGLTGALSHQEVLEHHAVLVKRAALPLSGGQNDGGSVESIAQLMLGRQPAKRPYFIIIETSGDGSELSVPWWSRRVSGTQLALLAEEQGLKPTAQFKMRELLSTSPELMLKWQEADGSWKAAGQLPSQNRPRAESNEVSTAWTLLALGSLDRPSSPVTKSIDSGLAFFRKSKPGKSHESLLMHMLIEHRFGKSAAAEPFVKDVLARQNADGGWSWLAGGSSDAFATGQTLYALSQVGFKSAAAPIQRARQYLLDTQSMEGIWEVPPQAIADTKDKGRIRRLVPIYHFWGSAWAVIGLSRSLGS